MTTLSKTVKLLRTLLLLVTVLSGSLVIFLIAPGCARVAESKAEKAVNDLLPSFLGPADKYATRIRGDSAGAVLRGRLQSVHIEGDNVRFEDGLVIDRLTMDFDSVSVDTRARKLTSIGAARFTARIGVANLNRYVTANRPTLAGLIIALGPGTASVEARPEVLANFGISGVKVPITVDGRLAPTPDGTQLDFVPGTARLSVLPIPRPLIDYLARALNPAVDLSTLPIPVRIHGVEIKPDGVYLQGTASSEGLLRAAETRTVAPATRP
ncbi:MAG: DUF2993 domain-containing protein [Cytophagales bacterium]|nr:DUF2993 domain-containing protein [Armatimonadota bacterium]